LRVIDARKHGSSGLPEAGLKVINSFRHRMFTRPCHEPVSPGAGRGNGERRQQSGKNDPTDMHILSFVFSRTLLSTRTSQGALLEPSASRFRQELQGIFIIPDFPDEQRVS
jgi:hypothetical protein